MRKSEKVGQRVEVKSSRIRRKCGVDKGPNEVILTSKVTVPVRIWSVERKAAFLLENAVDRKDYEWARREVRRMGLDPDRLARG